VTEEIHFEREARKERVHLQAYEARKPIVRLLSNGISVAFPQPLESWQGEDILVEEYVPGTRFEDLPEKSLLSLRWTKEKLAKAIIAEMDRLGYPVQLTGQTSFDEIIVGGVISGVQDGSVDELIAAREILVDGARRPGPGGKSVVVVETSTMKAPISERLRVHDAVLKMLEKLYQETNSSF